MVVAQQKDNKDCKDNPLFTRMPGYWIHSCTEKAFDSHNFATGKKDTIAVEGCLTRTFYLPQNTLNPKPSELEILRNYENAIVKLGGL